MVVVGRFAVGVVAVALAGVRVRLAPRGAVVAALRRLARAHRVLAGRHLALLRRIDEAFAADGIPAIALKGPLFAVRYYSTPAARASRSTRRMTPDAIPRPRKAGRVPMLKSPTVPASTVASAVARAARDSGVARKMPEGTTPLRIPGGVA